MSTLNAQSVAGRAPIIVANCNNPSASLIFFHGLGDQGDGWSSILKQEMQMKHFKYIVPNAASRPVTLNFGMQMPAWYDLYGLDVEAGEDEQGIELAKQYAHSLIDNEISKGIPSNRIVLGGFSMGAALAIYAGLTYTKPLGCIISFSGFLLQRQKLPKGCSVNEKIPIFMGHGQNDSLVPLRFSQMTEQTIKQFNPNVSLKFYLIDHSTTKEEQNDAIEFIQKYVPNL